MSCSPNLSGYFAVRPAMPSAGMAPYACWMNSRPAHRWCAASSPPASGRATSARSFMAMAAPGCARRLAILGRLAGVPDPVAVRTEGLRNETGAVLRRRIVVGLSRPDLLEPDRRDDDAQRIQHRPVIGGCRSDLGFAVRSVAVRPRLRPHQGALRQDPAVPVRRRNPLLAQPR